MSLSNLINNSQLALVKDLISQKIIKTPEVIAAMKNVDRKNFSLSNSYMDAPQPTYEGQTISAPHMHGFALELLSTQILVNIIMTIYIWFNF